VALPTDGTPRLVFYGVLCHDTSEVVDLQLSLADASARSRRSSRTSPSGETGSRS
jgi:hypothetical protein